MAYIEERRIGWLVVWRDETGQKQSQLVKWGIDVTDFEGDGATRTVTRDRARAEAEALREEMAREEPRAKRAAKREHERMVEAAKRHGYEPLFARPDAEPFRFVNYLRSVIERDQTLKPSTREAYEIALRNHFDETDLGNTDIRDITSDMVLDYWSKVRAAHRRVWQLLSQTFNAAIVRGHIEASPLKRTGIKVPSKARRSEIVPLTVDELERLAAAAKFKRDRLAILLMGYGGLRGGEVGGLRVEDVDVERCRLRLRQQVIQLHSRRVVTSLKTGSSRRTVPIPCSLAEELRAFTEEVPRAKDGRIFHGANDSLLAHQAINNAVQRAAKAAGLRPVHAHLLRHTAVSLLIDDGVNPKAIQAFCGHARIQETLDTYGHLFDYGADALGESMERRREQHRNGRTA